MYAENHPRSRGPSGEVWLGKLYDKNLSSDSFQEVAVKVIWLKPQEDHSSQRLLRVSPCRLLERNFSADHPSSQHLLREVVPWYDLDHPNIASFIGYDFDATSARMVSDWQPNGNALQYVRKHPEVDRLSLVSRLREPVRYTALKDGSKDFASRRRIGVPTRPRTLDRTRRY